MHGCILGSRRGKIVKHVPHVAAGCRGTVHLSLRPHPILAKRPLQWMSTHSLRKSNGPSVHSVYELHVLGYALQGYDIRIRFSKLCPKAQQKSLHTCCTISYNWDFRCLRWVGPACQAIRRPVLRDQAYPADRKHNQIQADPPKRGLFKAMEGPFGRHLGSR